MIESEGILYLEYEDALSVWAVFFEWTPQQVEDQIRNRNGIESALARPRQFQLYYDADIALQAAVLAHGIAEGQPFIEGNKRAAYSVSVAFLGANGYNLTASRQEVGDWIEELATTNLPEEDLAIRIRVVLVSG